MLPACGAPSSGRHASQYRTELFDEGNQGNVCSAIPAFGNWPRQIARPAHCSIPPLGNQPDVLMQGPRRRFAAVQRDVCNGRIIGPAPTHLTRSGYWGRPGFALRSLSSRYPGERQTPPDTKLHRISEVMSLLEAVHRLWRSGDTHDLARPPR